MIHTRVLGAVLIWLGSNLGPSGVFFPVVYFLPDSRWLVPGSYAPESVD